MEHPPSQSRTSSAQRLFINSYTAELFIYFLAQKKHYFNRISRPAGFQTEDTDSVTVGSPDANKS